MSPPYVKASRATKVTCDRFIGILSDKLPSELDSEQNRNASDVAENGSGVYVPDPDSYYRKLAPSQNDIVEMTDFVAIYVGPRGSPDYADFSHSTAGGELTNVDWDWGVNFVLRSQAGYPTTSDVAQSRDLADHEVLERRAQTYADTLRHTLSKWGHVGSAGNDRDDSINELYLGDFSGTVAQFGPGPDAAVMVGAGFVEVSIDQWQLLPSDAYTT